MKYDILDVDGKNLRRKVENILSNIPEALRTPLKFLDSNLLKTYFIFYKIGVGMREYQDMIREGGYPKGYEVLSAYMIDRFLSRYYSRMDLKDKIFMIKAVEIYPYIKYDINEGGVDYLPTKVIFLEEAIRLLEELTSKYLGFKPLCRMIMSKDWDKEYFIKWYARNLSGRERSSYNMNREYIDSLLSVFLDTVLNFEEMGE